MSAPSQVTIIVPITIEALAAIKNNAKGPEMKALLDATKQAAAKAAESLPRNIEASNPFDDPTAEDQKQHWLTVKSPSIASNAFASSHSMYVVGGTTLKELMQMYEGYTRVPTHKQRLCYKARIICDGDQDVRSSLPVKHFFTQSSSLTGGFEVTVFTKA